MLLALAFEVEDAGEILVSEDLAGVFVAIPVCWKVLDVVVW